MNISGSSRDLSAISIKEENNWLSKLRLSVQRNIRDIASLYCHFTNNWTALRPVVELEVNFYQSRVGRLFIPQFYHDRASTNFLKHIIYLGEAKPENSKNELQYPKIGIKYYSDKKKKKDFLSHKSQSADIDWRFPDKYFKSIGLTVKGFQFLLPNLSNLLKSFFPTISKFYK